MLPQTKEHIAFAPTPTEEVDRSMGGASSEKSHLCFIISIYDSRQGPGKQKQKQNQKHNKIGLCYEKAVWDSWKQNKVGT